MKILTVETLRKLPFRFVSHLNFGKDHARVLRNDEYGLSITVVTSKPQYRITRRVLIADCLGEKGEADLLSDDFDSEVEAFVASYNNAKEKLGCHILER